MRQEETHIHDNNKRSLRHRHQSSRRRRPSELEDDVLSESNSLSHTKDDFCDSQIFTPPDGEDSANGERILIFVGNGPVVTKPLVKGKRHNISMYATPAAPFAANIYGEKDFDAGNRTAELIIKDCSGYDNEPMTFFDSPLVKKAELCSADRCIELVRCLASQNLSPSCGLEDSYVRDGSICEGTVFLRYNRSVCILWDPSGTVDNCIRKQGFELRGDSMHSRPRELLQHEKELIKEQRAQAQLLWHAMGGGELPFSPTFNTVDCSIWVFFRDTRAEKDIRKAINLTAKLCCERIFVMKSADMTGPVFNGGKVECKGRLLAVGLLPRQSLLPDMVRGHSHAMVSNDLLLRQGEGLRLMMGPQETEYIHCGLSEECIRLMLPAFMSRYEAFRDRYYKEKAENEVVVRSLSPSPKQIIAKALRTSLSNDTKYAVNKWPCSPLTITSEFVGRASALKRVELNMWKPVGIPLSSVEVLFLTIDYRRSKIRGSILPFVKCLYDRGDGVVGGSSYGIPAILPLSCCFSCPISGASQGLIHIFSHQSSMYLRSTDLYNFASRHPLLRPGASEFALGIKQQKSESSGSLRKQCDQFMSWLADCSTGCDVNKIDIVICRSYAMELLPKFIHKPSKKMDIRHAVIDARLDGGGHGKIVFIYGDEADVNCFEDDSDKNVMSSFSFLESASIALLPVSGMSVVCVRSATDAKKQAKLGWPKIEELSKMIPNMLKGKVLMSSGIKRMRDEVLSQTGSKYKNSSDSNMTKGENQQEVREAEPEVNVYIMGDVTFKTSSNKDLCEILDIGSYLGAQWRSSKHAKRKRERTKTVERRRRTHSQTGT